jgi:hypothetical protein
VSKTAYIAEGAYTYERIDTYGDGMVAIAADPFEMWLGKASSRSGVVVAPPPTTGWISRMRRASRYITTEAFVAASDLNEVTEFRCL